MRIVLACLVVTALTIEARSVGAYILIGSGTSSCGTWTADRRAPDGPPALLDEQWVMGFLSGIGYVGQQQDDPLRGIDAEAVFAWIDNYCRDHPLEHIVDASKAVYRAHPHE
jgi:hypothetical protein